MKQAIKILLCLVAGVTAAALLLNGGLKLREKAYYMDESNYITEEAIVDNVIYRSDSIIFWLSEIDDAYSDSNFIIKGENAEVLLQNGIAEKIEIGDKILFTSAPRYFGDGYFMHIVSLSAGEECLLPFEDGYRNLIASY